MALTNLVISNPTISIVIISFLITLVMTLITKNFSNQVRMKELKAKQKECQKRLKEKKGDIESQKSIQKEMMGFSAELMKHSFKPMLITFVPLLLLFWWLRGIYTETSIVSTWIWWYIGTSVISSIVLRKVMNVV